MIKLTVRLCVMLIPVLLCSSMAQAGCCGGSTDPAPGAAFQDLPQLANSSTERGVFRGELTVKQALININGSSAKLLTYNGMFPGPTIRVARGERLKLHFVNALPSTSVKNLLGFERNHTNLHTHGLHVSPEKPADASHLDIPAGGTYDYDYDLALQYPGTLNIYHPHCHGLVAEQYWSGLVGAIVVEDAVASLRSYETHLMLIKDIGLSGGEPQPHATTMDYMHGKEGNIIMVNGQVNPVLTIRPGQVQRWQIMNASNARYYKLNLQNHLLNIVGTDGGLLDKPYPVSSMLLAPGERLDVLVQASKKVGTHKLLSLPYSRMGQMNSSQITLLTLTVKGAAANDLLPASVNPAAQRLNLELSSLPHRELRLSMMRGRGFINGQDFDVKPYLLMSDLGTYEVWDVINDTNMDHPFHQHTDAAQVLAVTGGEAEYAKLLTNAPAWKDTTNVPKSGRVRLLVPVMDWEGMAMFHCHILEHEDIGMMGMWHRMTMSMPMALPEDAPDF